MFSQPSATSLSLALSLCLSPSYGFCIPHVRVCTPYGRRQHKTIIIIITVTIIERARGAGGRLFSLLEREPRIEDGHLVPSKPRMDGRIEFRDVHFSVRERYTHALGVHIIIHTGNVTGVLVWFGLVWFL